jgi:transposase
MPRRELVPDSFWRRIQPMLPSHPSRSKGGRPPADDRACLRGIIFVLKTGIQWEQLPQEVFGVSGMTCWRRLRDWYQAGVWQALQRELLAELRRKGRLDLSRASADSSSVRALKRGLQPVRTRRIERRRAASIIFSLTAKDTRWQCA